MRNLVIAAALAASSIYAHADTISAPAVASFTIAPSADTLSLSSLNVSAVPGQNFSWLGNLVIGNSPGITALVPFTFTSPIAVNGTVKNVIFSAVDDVTLTFDTLSLSPVGPIIFGDRAVSFSLVGSPSSAIVGQSVPFAITGTLVSVAPTPEPTSLVLLATGLFGVASLRFRSDQVA